MPRTMPADYDGGFYFEADSGLLLGSVLGLIFALVIVVHLAHKGEGG